MIAGLGPAVIRLGGGPDRWACPAGCPVNFFLVDTFINSNYISKQVSFAGAPLKKAMIIKWTMLGGGGGQKSDAKDNIKIYYLIFHNALRRKTDGTAKNLAELCGGFALASRPAN